MININTLCNFCIEEKTSRNGNEFRALYLVVNNKDGNEVEKVFLTYLTKKTYANISALISK